MDSFLQSIPIFTSIGIVVFGVGYLIVQYRKGGDAAGEETLKLREQQVEAFRDQLKLLEEKALKREQESKEREIRFNQEIKELTGKIGELTGLLTAREKENRELRDIILARNPEVEVFYKQGMQYFGESKPVLEAMKEFMTKIEKHFEANTAELRTQTDELRHQSEVLEKTQ